MDIFALHGVGGMLGLLFTGLCADATITGFDGVTTIKGGAMNRNWSQMRIQAVYIAATAVYTFAVSASLLKLINFIPVLRLKCSEEEESMGMDAVDVGEFANDFVEVRRDYRDWGQSEYRPGSRQSTNTMPFILMPPYLGGPDTDEVSLRESIVTNSAVLSKKAHARLATPKATHVKLLFSPPDYIKPPNL